MQTLTVQNFHAEIAKSKLPLIVDCWADWCQPCKMLAPVFEKLSHEFEGKLTFAKFDIDASPELAQELDIRGIPCMILFKNGKEIERLVGAMNESALREKIKDAVKKI